MGDMHGSRRDMQAVYKLVSGYDFVFQVGDFGYWPQTHAGREFLDICAGLVQETGVPFYWLPGNHEDYSRIAEDMAYCDRTEEGFVMTRPGVFMVPRSLSWTWAGTNFCAVGGAFSIDRDSRVEGSGSYGWFPQELPIWRDVEAIEPSRHVMFAHDAAVNIARRLGWRELDRSNIGRNIYPIIQAAMRIAEPNVLVSGHWHRRMDYDFVLDNRTIPCHVLDATHIHLYDALADIENGKVTPWTSALTTRKWTP